MDRCEGKEKLREKERDSKLQQFPGSFYNVTLHLKRKKYQGEQERKIKAIKITKEIQQKYKEKNKENKENREENTSRGGR